MNRASPVEMRKALEAANVFKLAGILFVPVPIRNDEAYARITKLAEDEMEFICQEVEAGQ